MLVDGDGKQIGAQVASKLQLNSAVLPQVLFVAVVSDAGSGQFTLVSTP